MIAKRNKNVFQNQINIYVLGSILVDAERITELDVVVEIKN